jgi:hypothetical protein
MGFRDTIMRFLRRFKAWMDFNFPANLDQL